MPKIQNTDFSTRLRQLMKAKGVNQKQMAQAVGVAQGSVSGWLNGAQPNSAKLQLLAGFLGVSSDILLFGEEHYQRSVDSEARIMEAADLSEQYGSAREKQLAFEYNLTLEHLKLANERADASEKKLEQLRKKLSNILDELGD